MGIGKLLEKIDGPGDSEIRVGESGFFGHNGPYTGTVHCGDGTKASVDGSTAAEVRSELTAIANQHRG